MFKLFLLALVGFAAASGSVSGRLGWRAGTEYVYNYSGRLLTGIPELAERHFSGMGIQCEVHLAVSNDDPNLVNMRVLSPKYVNVNGQLEQSSGDQKGTNWRFLGLPGFKPVPESTSRMLASPIIFRLTPGSGIVESITLSSEEQEWATNFKKALIVLFQTQNAPDASVHTNSLNDFIRGDESSSRNFWSTKEESLDGVCNVRYEVFEMPRSTVLEDEEKFDPENCSGDVYELIKTRDVNNCEHRRAFSFAKPGTYDCHHGLNRTGNCGGMWSRSSVTRYVLCDTESSGLVINSIVNEGELQQDLMGFKSEKITTGTRQVLQLTSKRLSSGSVSPPSSPVKVNSLLHKYGESSKDAIKKVPGMSAAGKGKDTILQEMKGQFKEIIDHDLFTHVGLPETQISLKVLGLAKGFRSLEEHDMESLYHQLKGEYGSEEKINVFKNIYFDTALMSGTGESVRFVKKMILQGQTTPSQAESILHSWARNVIAPNARLLEEIYELVTSSKIREMSRQNGGNNVYNSAVLGYSILLEKACLSYNRNVTYPTWLYGQFCSKDSYIIEAKWIPYLQEKVQPESQSSNEEKQIHVVALALLGHRNVLPTLYNVVSNSEHYPTTLRTLAVYAHTAAGRHYSRRVLSTLSAVYFNQEEETDVRAAAFTVMMKLSPDMFLLQKIATLTWNETDYEILKQVNTAFYSLSQATSLEDMKPDSSELVRRVRLIYPLIKKTGGEFPTTANFYFNDYLTRLDIGYERTNTWVTSKGASTPTFFYNKINYLMDEYRFTPLEYGFNIRGADSIVKDILKTITGKKVSDGRSEEWRKTFEQLKIKQREESERPEGNFYINFFETMPNFYSFAEDSVESLREKASSMIKNPGKLLKKVIGGDTSSNEQVSYQRAYNLAPNVFTIPSDMGLPISMEVNMPLVLSAQGKLQPELTGSHLSIKSQVQVMASLHYIGWVGTIDPFGQEYVVTGIDQHLAINVPAEIQWEFNGPQQNLRVNFKAMQKVNTIVDIFHYHVRPYTVRQKLWEITPMTLSPEMKVISSSHGVPLRTIQQPVFESFGLGMDLKIQTQTNVDSLKRAFYEKLKLYNYNPLNMIRFMMVSTAYSPAKKASVRLHVIKLQYDPRKATTKEIETVFKVGAASKEEGKMPKYHVINSESRSWKIESLALGSDSRHSQRMNKIQHIIEKSGIKSGYGVNIDWKTEFKGSATRTVEWNFSAGFGSDAEIKAKYDIQLETNQNVKVCLQGQVDQPLGSAKFNIHKIRSESGSYKFKSVLGFGSTCQERQIQVDGSTRTSETQKKYSKSSMEAMEYQKLVDEGAPLAHLSEAAEKVRRQASTLDEVDYTIKYKNLPNYYIVAGERFVEFLQIYFLPNLSNLEPISSGGSSEEGSGQVNVAIQFHPNNGTVALEINRNGKPGLYFDDIVMPFPFAYFVPVSGVEPLAAWRPATCKVEGKTIRSYDGQIVPFREDGCYKMLSVDPVSKLFGIRLKSDVGADLARTLRMDLFGSYITIEVEIGKDKTISPRVNGKPFDLSRSGPKTIKYDGIPVAVISRSSDDVVTIDAGSVLINYDYHLLEIHPSRLLKGELAGLCGNMNNDIKDDLVTPGRCFVSDPQVLSASWTFPSSSGDCKPLSEDVKEKLRMETEERCVSTGTRSLRYGSGSEDMVAPRSGYNHLILDRSARGELCFSRRDYLECGGGSRPEGLTFTDVAFHCMPKESAEAKSILERIRRRRPVPELAGMSTTFEREVLLPTTCKKDE